MKKSLLLILAVVFAFSMNAQIFSDDFQDNDISDWTTVAPNFAAAPFTWHLSSYSGDYYLSASDYDGADHATEQWIISPAFSTTGYTGVSITFDNRIRYTPTQDLELYVSTDFAGDSASFSSATWTQITGLTIDTYNGSDDYDWATTTDAPLNVDNQATVYIAFKYVSSDTEGGNWVVNNVVVNGTGSSNVSEVNSGLKLFPNPATSVLNISSVSNIRNISVSNVIGQRVVNFNEINTDNYSLNVADLAKGVYLINIENVDGTSVVTKFVKK